MLMFYLILLFGVNSSWALMSTTTETSAGVKDTPVNGPLMKITMKLLESGNREIQLLETHKDLMLLVGLSGSGKSTMAHLLTDQPLTLEAYEFDHEILIRDAGKKSNHGNPTSEGLFPKLIVDHETGEAMYDCPGFKDTRNTSVEIANGFFIKKLVGHAESIKILVIVKHEAVTIGTSHSLFTSLVKQLLQFMRNVPKYKGAIALVVTKLDISAGDTRAINKIASFLELARPACEQLFPDRKTDLDTLFDAWLEKDSQGKYVNLDFFRQPTEPGMLSEMPQMRANRDRLRQMVFNNTHFKHVHCNASDFGIQISAEVTAFVQQIQRNLSILEPKMAASGRFHQEEQLQMIADQADDMRRENGGVVEATILQYILLGQTQTAIGLLETVDSKADVLLKVIDKTYPRLPTINHSITGNQIIPALPIYHFLNDLKTTQEQLATHGVLRLIQILNDSGNWYNVYLRIRQMLLDLQHSHACNATAGTQLRVYLGRHEMKKAPSFFVPPTAQFILRGNPSTAKNLFIYELGDNQLEAFKSVVTLACQSESLQYHMSNILNFIQLFNTKAYSAEGLNILFYAIKSQNLIPHMLIFKLRAHFRSMAVSDSRLADDLDDAIDEMYTKWANHLLEGRIDRIHQGYSTVKDFFDRNLGEDHQEAVIAVISKTSQRDDVLSHVSGIISFMDSFRVDVYSSKGLRILFDAINERGFIPTEQVFKLRAHLRYMSLLDTSLGARLTFDFENAINQLYVVWSTYLSDDCDIIVELKQRHGSDFDAFKVVSYDTKASTYAIKHCIARLPTEDRILGTDALFRKLASTNSFNTWESIRLVRDFSAWSTGSSYPEAVESAKAQIPESIRSFVYCSDGVSIVNRGGCIGVKGDSYLHAFIFRYDSYLDDNTRSYDCMMELIEHPNEPNVYKIVSRRTRTFMYVSELYPCGNDCKTVHFSGNTDLNLRDDNAWFQIQPAGTGNGFFSIMNTKHSGALAGRGDIVRSYDSSLDAYIYDSAKLWSFKCN